MFKHHEPQPVHT